MSGLAGTGSSLSGDGNGTAGRPRVTRRQAQILDLAAAGLSDKEIANRLQVSHRTVRTHFEKLFRDRGLRNRSQAVAMWSGRPTHEHKSRPADECPYPKPFPPGFGECPAYQASQMVTLDMSYRPLGTIWTCRHLEGRMMPNADYRWYGACVIGDAEARRRWSNQVGADRLQQISDLRQELSALSTPFVQRLLELRRAQRGSPEHGQREATAPIASPSTTAGVRQMMAVVDEFMTEVTTLLQERKAVLDDLHLPLKACLQLVRIAIDQFVEHGLTEAEWKVPDEVLKLFPNDLRSYFRPDEKGGHAVVPLAKRMTS